MKNSSEVDVHAKPPSFLLSHHSCKVFREIHSNIQIISELGPALLMKQWSFDWSRISAWLIRLETLSSLVTSQTTKATLSSPNWADSWARVSAPRLSLMSEIQTLAPGHFNSNLQHWRQRLLNLAREVSLRRPCPVLRQTR